MRKKEDIFIGKKRYNGVMKKLKDDEIKIDRVYVYNHNNKLTGKDPKHFVLNKKKYLIII